VARPSTKGLLANIAVVIGERRSDTRSLRMASASLEKSRFACTVQVRSIMSRPIEPRVGRYSRITP
jgi:hypothetical protein